MEEETADTNTSRGNESISNGGDKTDDGGGTKDQDRAKETTFTVTFLGSEIIDELCSQTKFSQVISDIKRTGTPRTIKLRIARNVAVGIAVENHDLLLEHNLQNISRFAQTAQDRCYFSYIVKEINESNLIHSCYLFKASDKMQVPMLFSAIRGSTKEKQCNSLSPCKRRDSSLKHPIDISEASTSSFQHFEVQYIGRIKVSHSKAPPRFIDESLEKFVQYETEKWRILSGHNSARRRHGSGSSYLGGSATEQFSSLKENEPEVQKDNLPNGTTRNSLKSLNIDESLDTLKPIPKTCSVGSISTVIHAGRDDDSSKFHSRQSSSSPYRTRALSGSNADLLKRAGHDKLIPIFNDRNRIMLFQIGLIDMSLISLDKKVVTLIKPFKDISHCSQGIKNSDHFGFICREQTSDNFIGYILKCQSVDVCNEIMSALKQAFNNAAEIRHDSQSSLRNKESSELKRELLYCDSCPLFEFHNFSIQLEGCSVATTQAIIQKHLETLSNDEQSEIKSKFEGAEVIDMKAENDIKLMLLRAHCEMKQSRHSHTSDLIHSVDFGHLDNKHESVMDSLKKKAKRTFTSSFENMLKVHRKSRDGTREAFRERSFTLDLEPRLARSQNSSAESSPCLSKNRKDSLDLMMEETPESTLAIRPRSSTISGLTEFKRESYRIKQSQAPTKSTLKMNMFLKSGNQMKFLSQQENGTPQISWRQAIFRRIITNRVNDEPVALISDECQKIEKTSRANKDGEKPTNYYQSLWKKAIKEQILLIRMEKENKKLKANQDAIFNKRVKLDYEEITPCLKDVTQLWEEMLQRAAWNRETFDSQKILAALRAGVPKHRRGEIWQFIMQQQRSRSNSPAVDADIEIVYEELLRQLTSHQHAILIDLGRTFPQHPYFSMPLGPGQLSLFNLLKAYSLIDKEVGYCQGLSFIAGVLLLHTDEDSSFEMLKYLLFHCQIRRQYKPDMVALQIEMYQLSRLIHDSYPELHDHFERQEVSSTLYAAPWFLTLYASQFPLGFVARVFDLLFLDGIEVIFKVALVLLGNHKELIIQCNTFEATMDFLKTTLPSLGIIQMERIFNQVFTIDIRNQLQAYEVEYHVLHEEMFSGSGHAGTESVQQLETTNRTLKRQNFELKEQLQVAHTTIHSLESMMSTYQTNISHLETRVRELELDRLSLKKTVETLRGHFPEMEFELPELKIPSPKLPTSCSVPESISELKMDGGASRDEPSSKSLTPEDELLDSKPYNGISSSQSIGDLTMFSTTIVEDDETPSPSTTKEFA